MPVVIDAALCSTSVPIMGVSTELLDLAQFAIRQAANITSELGVKHKKLICGRLGAELLLVRWYLEAVGEDQEKCLRLRIPRLLRDVGRICNVSDEIETFLNVES